MALRLQLSKGNGQVGQAADQVGASRPQGNCWGSKLNAIGDEFVDIQRFKRRAAIGDILPGEIIGEQNYEVWWLPVRDDSGRQSHPAKNRNARY